MSSSVRATASRMLSCLLITSFTGRGTDPWRRTLPAAGGRTRILTRVRHVGHGASSGCGVQDCVGGDNGTSGEADGAAPGYRGPTRCTGNHCEDERQVHSRTSTHRRGIIRRTLFSPPLTLLLLIWLISLSSSLRLSVTHSLFHSHTHSLSTHTSPAPLCSARCLTTIVRCYGSSFANRRRAR